MTSDAKEFIAITKRLEPVQCEKRQLRREIVMAETENRMHDVDALKKRFARLTGGSVGKDRTPLGCAVSKSNRICPLIGSMR